MRKSKNVPGINGDRMMIRSYYWRNFNHTVALRINAQRKPARIRESTLNKIDSISKESNRSGNELINILLENSVDDVEIE